MIQAIVLPCCMLGIIYIYLWLMFVCYSICMQRFNLLLRFAKCRIICYVPRYLVARGFKGGGTLNKGRGMLQVKGLREGVDGTRHMGNHVFSEVPGSHVQKIAIRGR
jgi:hypothetical protein